MTTHDKDKIIAAAKKAGMHIGSSEDPKVALWWYPEVERFYAIGFEDGRQSVDTPVALAEAYRCGEEAGRQAEREECAKVCEKERVAEDATHNREDAAYNMAIDHVVAAIRARGDTVRREKDEEVAGLVAALERFISYGNVFSYSKYEQSPYTQALEALAKVRKP